MISHPSALHSDCRLSIFSSQARDDPRHAVALQDEVAGEQGTAQFARAMKVNSHSDDAISVSLDRHESDTAAMPQRCHPSVNLQGGRSRNCAELGDIGCNAFWATCLLQ